MSQELAHRDVSAESEIGGDRHTADIDERVLDSETPCCRNLGGGQSNSKRDRWGSSESRVARMSPVVPLVPCGLHAALWTSAAA